MTSSTLSEPSHKSDDCAIANLRKPITLIGLMGAGKTTVGRRLAKMINRDFVDSDSEIEEAAGCSISDIFTIHGENIFRDLEMRVIKRLVEQPNLVIATGGGAWMQPEIRQTIQEHSLPVWLEADLDTLLERVEKRSHRPLLEIGDKREILDSLMQKRYPVYAQAELTIHSGDATHEQIVDDIICAITKHLGNSS